ncbi:DUF4153 domain-containing protein [Sphingomonas sp. M1-B02]|uniref:DUF4153 domain-containing protein n=1 Tax=Sphingomonas sp. M1-B02 TaxID=3114300 RepID=UPI00223F4880|nr:DUF4153 domain-containing protein [Sphingomonas sp. S6-11]UZK66426.1 DUF4153 domain-containing protein [Sphingomonas sp. S6-11]
MDADERVTMEVAERDWGQRPLILGAIGLAAGLLAHLILGVDMSTLSTLQAASLTAVTLAAVLTGFTLERRLWWASVLFSLAVAGIGALIVAWNGPPDDWGVGEGWRMVSLLMAVAIAAPLFQAARDEGARRFPYPAVHDHAWTNVVLFGACCLFVGITFALAWLLAMLFDLIKISFLKELLEKEWFWRGLIGLAFGGALGLLREHDGVVRLLQRVVAMVLAVLAPVLAIGLILFVLALPFTGLNALWEATSATTPILLCCVAGALILANAVIGNAPDQERRSPPLRYGAMGLAAVILPLAVLAAVAIQLRIGQYGYTPERLWAVVFIGIACLWGAAYLAALVRGRRAWAARVRPLNLTLAFLVCGVALLLATPLISFNAISTRDQVARLESGRVTAEKFDWRALAFDFGEPGKAALKRLQASRNVAIRERAGQVAKAGNRWDVPESVPSRAEVARRIRVLPAGAKLSEGVLDQLATLSCTASESGCTVLVVDPTTVAVLRDSCFAHGGNWLCNNADQLRFVGGKWIGDAPTRSPQSDADTKAKGEAQRKGYAAGQVETRAVSRRQLYVGGVPVGDPFE